MLNNSFKFNMEEFNSNINRVNSNYNYNRENEYIYIQEDDDDDNDDDKKKKPKNKKGKDLKKSLDKQVKKATEKVIKKEPTLASKVVPRVAIYGGIVDAGFNNFGMAKGAGTLIGKGISSGARVVGEVGGHVVLAPFKAIYHGLRGIGSGLLG
jgi:hypothetical protein